MPASRCARAMGALAVLIAAFVVVAVCTALAPAAHAATGWESRGLPFDGYAAALQTDADKVLIGAAGAGDEGVYLYRHDGRRLERVSGVEYGGGLTAMDGDWLVWEGQGASGQDLFLYNASTGERRPVTTDAAPDLFPQVSGDHVAWIKDTGGAEGTGWETYLYRISTRQTTRLTTNTELDGAAGNLSLSGDLVAWQALVPIGGDVVESRVRAYVISSGTRVGLSRSGVNVGWCQVSGGRVMYAVWEASALSSIGVFDPLTELTSQVSSAGEDAVLATPWMGGVFDHPYVAYLGSSEGGRVRLGTPGGTPLTLGTTSDNDFPQVRDGLVVWTGLLGESREVFVYDIAAGTTTQLTTDAVDDQGAVTGGGVVAWAQPDPTEEGTVIRVATRAEAPVSAVFQDVPGAHPYRTAIEGLYLAEIVGGTRVEGDLRWFSPGDPVKRAQFAKMVVGTLEIAVDPAAIPPYSDLGDDVPGDPYPHQYVAAAAGNGITKGTSATEFSPWAPITRAQVVTMLVRGAKSLYLTALETPPAGYAGSVPDFFSPDHAENLRVAEHNGLLVGLEDFGAGWDPWAQASRGEVAQMMWNLRVGIEG